ncbi:MAG: hypothetical protein C0408_01750 [Odoribacter sp.]|nr:hypothetical protein [Odoribacter sp.]
MKKLIFTSLCLFIILAVQGQGTRTSVLEDLEKSNPSVQNQQVTATLKSASRLFGAKDDLTSVIMIVPSGSVVNVLGSDSTYYKVSFEENEGYIFKRHALINYTPAETVLQYRQNNFQQVEQPAEQKQVSRFTYLENKYGTNMAARLASGKIWKGMSAEMVRDSWGNPVKINRVIGNVVKEEWIFRNTWLYIENNTLVDWGPIRN